MARSSPGPFRETSVTDAEQHSPLTIREVAAWLRRQAAWMRDQAVLSGMYRLTREGDDAVVARVRQLYRESNLSMHELGIRMGYAPGHARQSVSRFLKSRDPRISTLRRFASAMDVPIDTLCGSDEEWGKVQ